MFTQGMKRCLFVLVAGLTVLAACSKEGLMVDPDNPLLGTWVQTGHEENSVIYTRAARLKNDGPGMVFQADGHVVLRGIAGWCATPPVSYTNYEGRWNQSGATLQTTVHYQWMPDASVQVQEIVSVDEKQLVLAYR